MCKRPEFGEEVSNPNPEEFSPITVKLYKGMPTVELTEDDKVKIHLELNEKMSRQITEGARKGSIQISLQSLEIERIHNQSFGMISASTGCVSNPGGPGC